MDVSSLEHVVIRAKLGDIIAFQIIELAEQSFFSGDNNCSGHRNSTNLQRLGEIYKWAWNLYSRYTVEVGVECIQSGGKIHILSPQLTLAGKDSRGMVVHRITVIMEVD